MSGGFEADVTAISTASSRFGDQYSRLVGVIGAFQNSSLDVNDAFGFLGPSVSVLDRYVKMAEDAFRGLDALAQRVSEAQQALATTALRYQDADTASTIRGGPS